MESDFPFDGAGWRCRSLLSPAVSQSAPAPKSDELSAARESPRSSSIQRRDRKSTRLNSSHVKISYAVFCLKKKKNSKTSSPSGGALLLVGHIPSPRFFVTHTLTTCAVQSYIEAGSFN